MAFKMKKPSMIEGTKPHKQALALLKTGYANKPDGRSPSSALQSHVNPDDPNEGHWKEGAIEGDTGVNLGDWGDETVTTGESGETIYTQKRSGTGKRKSKRPRIEDRSTTACNDEYIAKHGPGDCEDYKKSIALEASQTRTRTEFPQHDLKLIRPTEIPGEEGDIGTAKPVEPKKKKTKNGETPKDRKRLTLISKTKRQNMRFKRKKFKQKLKNTTLPAIKDAIKGIPGAIVQCVGDVCEAGFKPKKISRKTGLRKRKKSLFRIGKRR
mgnify:CR=1 FL=1|tara:strand:- start:779 stop:1582 length:804 start_codon:yes stop_codon:yes gene_type:complete